MNEERKYQICEVNHVRFSHIILNDMFIKPFYKSLQQGIKYAWIFQWSSLNFFKICVNLKNLESFGTLLTATKTLLNPYCSLTCRLTWSEMCVAHTWSTNLYVFYFRTSARTCRWAGLVAKDRRFLQLSAEVPSNL